MTNGSVKKGSGPGPAEQAYNLSLVLGTVCPQLFTRPLFFHLANGTTFHSQTSEVTGRHLRMNGSAETCSKVGCLCICLQATRLLIPLGTTSSVSCRGCALQGGPWGSRSPMQAHGAKGVSSRPAPFSSKQPSLPPAPPQKALKIK